VVPLSVHTGIHTNLLYHNHEKKASTKFPRCTAGFSVMMHGTGLPARLFFRNMLKNKSDSAIYEKRADDETDTEENGGRHCPGTDF
jgi:hypothetical protein